MTMDAIEIEIEELTPEQTAAIWAEQKKRPANYMEFVIYLRAKQPGAGFNVAVKGDTDQKREDHARSIRKWFGEAAKERVRFEERDGKTVEVPEPVAIRWKEESHKEKRKVTDPVTKKQGEVEIKIIDRLHGKLVPIDEVKTRGRAAADDSEQVDDLVTAQGPFAEGSKSVSLADGRVARLTRSGHWRAPKLAPAPTSNGANSSNGTAESTDKQPAGASAT